MAGDTDAISMQFRKGNVRERATSASCYVGGYRWSAVLREGGWMRDDQLLSYPVVPPPCRDGWQGVDRAMPETSRQALKEALSDQPLDVALADVELAVLGQIDGPASRERGQVTVGMAPKGNPGLPVLGLNLAGILQDSDIDEQI